MNWYRCIGGSGGSATLITKTITANGTYYASSDSADGYSSVTVALTRVGGLNATEQVVTSTTYTVNS